MPAGVDRDQLLSWLGDTFGEEAAGAWWKWFSTTWRGWGQDGWKRVDAARDSCATLTPPTGPP